LCGIAGIVARRSSRNLRDTIAAMTARVRHRGPDGEGTCQHGRVALGHRRLAIIDLSSLGGQPMEYADGRYAITYNGEIYNHKELRVELEKAGYSFRSNTDTEVVLAAYDAFGPECLSQFNGMWAFAIHDRVENTVFAARDRFGVKPFYYVMTDECFAFGSEIRQLLPLLPSVQPNPRAVSEFILTGTCVQSKETFFQEVLALLPGHYLCYHLATDECVITRYYNLLQRIPENPERPAGRGLDDWREIFEDSVRLRMRSDVTVGTCLSGGLDSSSIALVAARMYRESTNMPLAAVTGISEDLRNNEEVFAREVVAAGALKWIRTRPTYEDFCTALPSAVANQEEPFNSPSGFMQHFVMRAARENGVTVLLGGQGGDETLLGYDRYYPAYCAMLWREGGIHAVLRGLREAVRRNTNMSVSRMVAFCACGLSPTLRYWYYRYRSGYMAERPDRPKWIDSFAEACGDFRSLQALEIETTSLPTLLRYEDKTSMAFGVETRLPFLDYRLVECSVAMPPVHKIHNGWMKWALREAMSDLLPPDIAWRPDKIGFDAPTELWLSRHAQVMATAVRGSQLVRRFCDIERLMRRYFQLDRNEQWRLYNLALWEETFHVQA
jgi:asparagine synthase (glutamine-hydrolysing)